MNNKPKPSSNTQITVTLPSGFTVPAKPSCYNTYDGTVLNCTLTKSEVTINNYFSQKSYTSRLLQATDDSLTSIVTVAIAIYNMSNSKNTSASSLSLVV